MASETGPYLLSDQPIEINKGKTSIGLTVWNTGDRAIQVGSHFHFFEVNKALRFDRPTAFGMRLNIPAGTAVRFEPGDRKDVHLVVFGGTQRVIGLNGLTNGSVGELEIRARAMSEMSRRGFADSSSEIVGEVSGEESHA